MTILEKIRKAKYVFVCGNGGSAATADHLCNDLVKKCGIKAISLCSNLALLTAYANDCGYENVFVEQLKVFLTKDDLLIVISTSGESKNCLKAIDYANKIGADVYEFPLYNIEKIHAENRHLVLAHKIAETL